MEIELLDMEIIAEQNPVNKLITNTKRKYDIIIFGASGYTGKFVVLEMGRLSQIYNLTWAVAGRNTANLRNVLNRLYQDGYEDKKIDVIYANVYDFESVMRMVQKTSVVINCTSPYYIYGEVVVKSCVLTSTHYVDVTSEPLFMEKMAFKYNKKAEENNSIIVNALGMDGVPADLGIEFLYKHFDGKLKNVDMYMKIYLRSFVFVSGFFHQSVWISALLHLASKTQRLFYRDLLDDLMGITRTQPNVSKILHYQQMSMLSDTKYWCLAYPEPDQSVVARSIHHAKTVENLPYNFSARRYMVINGLIPALNVLFIFFFLSFLVIFEPIRILLMRFSYFFTGGLVSKAGPGEKLSKNLSMTFSLIGYGTTSVKFPTTDDKEGTTQKNITATRKTIVQIEAENPGYGFTSKAVILGAITILKDQMNIPKGGVLTPAAAFRNTQFINRLIKHDAATFQIESDLVTYSEEKK
ncbi:saccharopine dehydrogenase-like oxidoreductase [Melanaphis sacchari]|uniref:saccharopine dehydrogenase-like oxidoreductase n=1 Tax=Melanaphis sacchari TaxID=742174 RepID=UPI000DC15625|nr:saccharopine dehydrogenase-like oxidoreductase [Melanaphis sacchari]